CVHDSFLDLYWAVVVILAWMSSWVQFTPTHRAYCGVLLFIAAAPPAISTLSLHDALPIWLEEDRGREGALARDAAEALARLEEEDRKSTRLNSSHVEISYAVFCLKKKNRPLHCTDESHAPAVDSTCHRDSAAVAVERTQLH